ncbi:MAG: NAD-dependent epimerase/dehydratase family protein [Cytophagales bacterium]|nr:MAG: NAD-dependent epimerase/dehydratase family protein [Cytophagales bacterium]
MQTLLITGGTGFLGKYLANKLKYQYKVVLTGRNQWHNQQAADFTDCEVIPMEVSQMENVREVFSFIKPDIVLHAAAAKNIFLSEIHPQECMQTNVVGSQNIARIAIERNIQTVIGISATTASPPVTGMYAMSKAMMEKLFAQYASHTDTQFLNVRLANILYSTGSLLRVWHQCASEGQLLPITDKQMTRFFMNTEEAVHLIERALQYATDWKGKTITQPMRAIEIATLLKYWIKKYKGGYKVVGKRIGETLHSFLIGDEELDFAEEVLIGNEKFFIISPQQKVQKPLQKRFSSETADKYTDKEINTLIDADELYRYHNFCMLKPRTLHAHTYHTTEQP